MRRLAIFRAGLVLVAWIAASCWLAPASCRAGDPPQRIKASNVVSLRELVGQEVTVYGPIASTGASSGSGHNFLNFANSELTAVCFAPDVANFKAGKPADVYRGKDVELTGKVEVFRGKLQIKLSQPQQIKIVDPAAVPSGSGAPAAKVELKKIGDNTWVSPAGLTYKGRDPQGLTRVEHILRHARDIPDREGSHGVFDGGPDAVFGVIDDAWRLVEKNRLRPETEEGRSLYTVSMGRRVGYLGGQTARPGDTHHCSECSSSSNRGPRTSSPLFRGKPAWPSENRPMSTNAPFVRADCYACTGVPGAARSRRSVTNAN